MDSGRPVPAYEDRLDTARESLGRGEGGVLGGGGEPPSREGFPSPLQPIRVYAFFHLVQNGPGRIGGDGGLGDGAAYDEEIAADAHGRAGVMMRRWSSEAEPDAGRIPGVRHIRPGAAGFDGFDFVAGADHAVQPHAWPPAARSAARPERFSP